MILVYSQHVQKIFAPPHLLNLSVEHNHRPSWHLKSHIPSYYTEDRQNAVSFLDGIFISLKLKVSTGAD